MRHWIFLASFGYKLPTRRWSGIGGVSEFMELVRGDISADASGRAAILVVDDEVLIRFMQAEALRDAGYEVVEAANGDEALALLRAGLDVSLLITDVRMPGSLDGLDLARAAHDLRPDLAIAISSAHVGAIQGNLDGIVADFLPKPYLPSRLIELANRLIG